MAGYTKAEIISIHALLAESDRGAPGLGQPDSNFYPRSPCGERHASRPCPVVDKIFLSTLCKLVKREINHHFYPRSPCGERPIILCCKCQELKYFYPRSPCGERLLLYQHVERDHAAISIHALLAESDKKERLISDEVNAFLSTLSLRRATVGQKRLRQKLAISIHALLAESDFARLPVMPSAEDFYPRSPCGERPVVLDTVSVQVRISIHALLAESDRMLWAVQAFRVSFLSTLSLRRATAVLWACVAASSNFYPRSPCGERPCCKRQCLFLSDFYPRSPCGERRCVSCHLWITSIHFYPRSPCGERRY